MRIPTSETNDTLDVDSLPPTEGTELNYRTRPDVESEIPFARHVSKVALFVAVIAAIAIRILVPDYLGFAAIALFGIVWWFVPSALQSDSDGAEKSTDYRPWLFASLFGCIALQTVLPSHLAAYFVAFPSALAALAGLILVFARQTVAWMSVNPKVHGEVGREWQSYFPVPGRWWLHENFPEARGTLYAPYFLVAAYLFGGLVFFKVGFDGRDPLAPALAIAGFAIFLAVIVGTRKLFALDAGFSLGLTARVFWRLLVVFLTYNRHRTPAPGVFRFPLRSLVDVDVRKRFLALSLFAAGLGMAVVVPPVWPPPVTAIAVEGQLLPHERDYLEQLPPEEAQRQSAEIVGKRTVTKAEVARLERERWQSIPRRIAAVLVLVPVGLVVLVILIAWVTVGELLAGYYLAFEAPGGRARTDDSEWDVFIRRLRKTEHALEREHTLLGFALNGDYPVYLHNQILSYHYHLTGDSGAMKTSLVVAPHSAQLMGRGDCSVVIIDLKGDRALFESCRINAKDAELPFSWFTAERGLSSFVFNPFEQSYHTDVTPEQESETLLQGMSLDYGVDYGRSFFTTQNEMTLKILMRKQNLKSAAQLHGYLDTPNATNFLTAKDVKDATHLRAIANRLMTIAPLNAVLPGGANRRIEVRDILHTPQVVYLSLKSGQEPLAAATIARLFLWSLFSCAAHRPSLNNRVYVYIDEFQQIIADGIKLVFEQARGLGVTLIPVHQTAGQLSRKGADLLETVDSCTAVKHILRSSDPSTVKRIEEMSGLQTYHSYTWTQDTTSGNGAVDPAHAVDGMIQIGESIGPALDRNTILAVSADPLASFVRFTAAAGYTQFGGKTTVIRSLFPSDVETYNTRAKERWPILPEEPDSAALASPAIDPKSSPLQPPEAPPTDWDQRFRDDPL